MGRSGALQAGLPPPTLGRPATHRASLSAAGVRAPQPPLGPLLPRGSGRSPRGPGRPPRTQAQAPAHGTAATRLWPPPSSPPYSRRDRRHRRLQAPPRTALLNGRCAPPPLRPLEGLGGLRGRSWSVEAPRPRPRVPSPACLVSDPGVRSGHWPTSPCTWWPRPSESTKVVRFRARKTVYPEPTWMAASGAGTAEPWSQPACPQAAQTTHLVR